MRATQVLPASIGKVWPHIEHWIKAALVRGSDHTLEQVGLHLARGTMQLWLAWDGRPRGVCVTELIEGARGRSCNIVIVAGEGFDMWEHLEADVARWAREQGCVRLSLTGRKGWVRRLHGRWRPFLVVMEQEL